MTTMDECVDFIMNETTREQFNSLKGVPFIKGFLHYKDHLNINTNESKVDTEDKNLLIYSSSSRVPRHVECRVKNSLSKLEGFGNGSMVLFMENKETNKAQLFSLNENTSKTIIETLTNFFERRL